MEIVKGEIPHGLPAYLFELRTVPFPISRIVFPPYIITRKSRLIRDLMREPERVVDTKDDWLDAVELPIEDRRDTVIVCLGIQCSDTKLLESTIIS